MSAKKTSFSIDSEIGNLFRENQSKNGKNANEKLERFFTALNELGYDLDTITDNLKTAGENAKKNDSRTQSLIEKIENAIMYEIDLTGKNPTASQISRKYSIELKRIKELQLENPHWQIQETTRGKKA